MVNKKISDFIITPGYSVRDAMRKLDESHRKILFVVDDKNKLMGSLSDGDIRRWILSEGSLNEKVNSVLFEKTFKVNSDYKIEEIRPILIKEKYSAVPIIDNAGCVIDILFWDEVFDDSTTRPPKRKLDFPVVIMAGGQGTRLEPFTKILPKPLIPIGDKSIIERIIDNFLQYGINDFYISINHKAKIIKSFFEELAPIYHVEFIEEKIPLGTIGSLSLLKNILTKPIIVTNCDIIINSDYAELLDFHLENKYHISLVASMMSYKIPYGTCEIENGGKLIRLTEKPEYSFLASTGMYIINPDVLNLIPDDKFFHMTNLIDCVKQNGGKIGVFPITQNSWMDTGEWEEYKKTVNRFNNFKIY